MRGFRDALEQQMRYQRDVERQTHDGSVVASIWRLAATAPVIERPARRFLLGFGSALIGVVFVTAMLWPGRRARSRLDS